MVNRLGEFIYSLLKQRMFAKYIGPEDKVVQVTEGPIEVSQDEVIEVTNDDYRNLLDDNPTERVSAQSPQDTTSPGSG